MSSFLKICVFLGVSSCVLVAVLLRFREFCFLRHQVIDVAQEKLGYFETSVNSTRLHDVAFQRQNYLQTCHKNLEWDPTTPISGSATFYGSK